MPQLQTSAFLHGGDYNPEQWLQYPEVIDKDFQLFRQASINTVTVGIFAWSKLEPTEGKFNFDWLDDIFDRVEAMHGHVILATPSGARPRWLAQAYPEVLRVDAGGRRALYGERENHCFTSPIYRKQVARINRALAEHFGQRKSLVLWHVSNEYGGACYCDLCQAAFRRFLQAKYHTLAALNDAYCADFWSHTYTDWSQVHSPAPHGDTGLLGLNLDWHRFVSAQTIDFFEQECQPLREVTPTIPITTNFMCGNPPESKVFFELDYQKFAQHLDIVSWDSYPNWATNQISTAELAMRTALLNDAMRSLKHQPDLIMESTPTQVNWQPVNRAKRPGMLTMGAMQSVAHGANGIGYFQLHQSRGASEMFHGAVITASPAPEKTRGFREVATVGAMLSHLQPVLKASHSVAKVGIIYDYDNMWALDDARNYAAQTKRYWETIQDHYDFFWTHDIAVELLSVDDDLSGYQLVIDPMHYLMTETFANKLKAYVKAGGTLVGTYLTGRVNEAGLLYPTGWPQALRELYGIDLVETDTFYPGQHNHLVQNGVRIPVDDYADVVALGDATSLASYTDDFYAGTPAVTKHALGAGQAYYLAARTERDALATFYAQLTDTLGLNEPLVVSKHAASVSIQRRGAYLFVINFSNSSAQLTLNAVVHELTHDGVCEAGPYTLNPYQVAVFTTKQKGEKQ